MTFASVQQLIEGTRQVIELNGNGRAFSAGFDLDMEVADSPKPDPQAVRKALHNDYQIIMRFWDSPKVSLAAAHGYCLGSAMELDAMTQALLMTTKDHAEFYAAFTERRPPRWQGR